MHESGDAFEGSWSKVHRLRRSWVTIWILHLQAFGGSGGIEFVVGGDEPEFAREWLAAGREHGARQLDRIGTSQAMSARQANLTSADESTKKSGMVLPAIADQFIS
jgi:hypothetical protein